MHSWTETKSVKNPYEYAIALQWDTKAPNKLFAEPALRMTH